MNPEKQKRIDGQISEQAAEWLDALRTGGPHEQAAFAEWVSASPRHLEEFLFISALENELEQVDSERRIDVRTLMAGAGGNVVTLKDEALAAAPARQRPHRWRWAAGFAVIGIAAPLTYISLPDDRYVTAVGEQRTIELLDGSVLQLNSKSRIEAKFTETGRDVELMHGEAMFKVAPDPARPFRVHAGGTTIRAIGTQFNVNHRPSGITVSVIEGRVRISGIQPATLGIGEEARISRSGHLERRGNIDPLNISAWRERRLVFRDDTLEDIAAEFNRHNNSPQILIDDDEILSRRYTAVFDANDPGSLIAFLSQDPELAVDQQQSKLVVRKLAARSEP